MKIFPLGTNGFFPSFGRQTASYAIPLGKLLIILDAGSGLFRLAEPEGKKLLEGVSEVHLFLSHYHLDHTFGFYAAFGLLKGKKVTVYAKEIKKVFSEFRTLGYFTIDYSKEYKDFDWKILKEGSNKIKDYEVQIRRQFHRGEGSLAFNFSFGLAYITDSESIKESVNFISGAKFLLHEHWYPGDDLLDNKNTKLEDHNIEGHVTSVGAAIIAKQSGVKKLALIHHHPRADNNQLEKQLKIAKTIFPNSSLAKDLELVNF